MAREFFWNFFLVCLVLAGALAATGAIFFVGWLVRTYLGPWWLIAAVVLGVVGLIAWAMTENDRIVRNQGG